MKKNLYYVCILAIGSIYLFSCKDDDDKKSPDITGTWVYMEGKYSSCDDGSPNDVDTDADGCNDENCATIKFENGNFTYTDNDMGDTYVMTGTYKLSGDVMTTVCKTGDYCDDIEPTATVSVSGSTLTLKGEDASTTCAFNETWEKQ